MQSISCDCPLPITCYFMSCHICSKQSYKFNVYEKIPASKCDKISHSKDATFHTFNIFFSITDFTSVIKNRIIVSYVTHNTNNMHRGHGTAYHLPSELFHPSPLFGNNWRHICLGSVLANFFTTFLAVIMTLWSATVSFAWQRHLNQYEGINNNNKTESPNSIRFMSFIVIVNFIHL